MVLACHFNKVLKLLLTSLRNTLFSNTFVITAIQISESSKYAPLLPPNEFVYLDGRTVISVDNGDDARWQYQTYMNMKTYKAKHCKYLDGALYKEIFYEVTDIVEVKQFGRTKIDVTTSDGQSTTTKIFHDGNKNNAHLCNCRKLGKFLSAFKGNTIRNKRMDDGDIYCW